MRWRSTKSALRWRLAFASFVCVLPVAALTIYLAHARQADEVRQAQNHVRLVVRLVAHEASRVITDTRQLMKRVVEDHHAEEPGRFDCRAAFRGVLQTASIYYQLALADTAGHVRCTAKPINHAIRIDDRAYFRRAMVTQRFVMSEALRARDSGRWTIVAARPVLDPSDKVIAVVLAALDLEKFQERIAIPTHGLSTAVSIVDTEGVILAQVPGGLHYVGHRIRQPGSWGADTSGQSSSRLAAAMLAGGPQLTAYQHLTDTPYYVRGDVSYQQIGRETSAVLIVGLFALVVVLALGVTFAWAASHYLVVAPLRQIMRSAQRLHIGNESSRTNISYDHPVIGRLAEILDTLAAKRDQVVRAHRTLSAGNRALLRGQTEQALLQEMCRVAVEVGGYPLAFVTYKRDDDSRSVNVVSYAGTSGQFTAGLQLSWGDDELGQGTVGTAIRTGRRCIVHNVWAEPRFAPWRSDAIRLGLRSAISLPLYVGGAVIGTLTLFASEEDAFDAAEVELLEEMAADLSFGIGAVRSLALRANAEAAAEQARTRDSITGLANRTSFIKDSLGPEVTRGSRGAVIVLHLRRLQDVFYAFGYGPVDEALGAIARRLTQVVGDERRVGRVSFSDFAILMAESDSGSIARTAHALLATIEEPILVDGAGIAVQGATGASFFPEHCDDPEVLVRRAVIAAREGSRLHVGYYKYRGGIQRENPARLALAADLSNAIERGQVTLHYQPKLSFRTGRISGKEGLIRWFHPERGAVAPSQFIPLAESTGQIYKISRFVLDAGIRQQSVWLETGTVVPLALNLSARDLQDRRYVRAIAQLLDKYGVAPELIDFEITETALIDDSMRARQVLKGIRNLGMKIYVDDFGAGYCALSYLAALPVTGIKIDRSFISQMTENSRAESIVSSVITMAHNLGLSVVAEGIESHEQFTALKAFDCDEAQGYYIGRPVSG